MRDDRVRVRAQHRTRQRMTAARVAEKQAEALDAVEVLAVTQGTDRRAGVRRVRAGDPRAREDRSSKGTDSVHGVNGGQYLTPPL